MNNATYTWFTRTLLILMCISVFLIVRIGEKYYIVSTSEVLAEDYIATLKNGLIDIGEYTNFSYRMGEFGYETELYIQRYGNDGYYDILNTSEITSATIDLNGREVYPLQRGDFVYVKLTSGSSVVKESMTFRGGGVY